MSLDTYNSKRSFSKTPEPTGGQPDNRKLQFVVQKHAASHLHYDFRLEVRGVLISWAVPKGPSMIEGENRLAMQTEDHPFDYLHFEGIIPKGQYGGGTVIVWDAGSFETTLTKEKDKKSQEHSLLSQYYKGKISFTLHGSKLKGKFEISRAKDKDEKSWYLVKQPDRFILKGDITRKDTSVLSGRTIEQVAADPNAGVWQSNRAGKAEKSPESKPTLADIPGALKAPMPENVAPMECRLIQKPFSEPGWIYELKLDGYRVLSWCRGGEVKLQSRGGLNYTKDYEVLLTPLKSGGKDFIIDGEVVVINEKGHPDFDALQRYRRNKAAAQLVYYVFDLVWLDGYDLMGVTLENRRMLLRELVQESDYIRFSEDLEEGLLMYDVIKESGLEGIVYKAKDSLYQPGKRGNYWLKLPTSIRQEFVIGGWTESASGHAFRSLVFGAYENGLLTYIGHAGHGFKDEDRKHILGRLKKLEIKDNPFVNKVDTDTPVHYVKPELVANIQFATWTTAKKIRKPAVFLGFREDKPANIVTREVPLSEKEEEQVIKGQKGSAPKKVAEPSRKKVDKAPSTMVDSNWPELEGQPITSEEVFTIDGKSLKLTNVERQLWKRVTKSDLIIYYHNIAEFILPYLKDRPQSLHIKHNGPGAPGMYIKDMESRQPQWAELFTTERKHKRKGKRDQIDYLVCQDEATLLYIVNLGCIDINPWTSRTTHYQQPDYIIIDLDPSDEDFGKVITTAQAAKQAFDKLKLKAYPKTSGKTGLHIYIPCEGFSFPQTRKIAEQICVQVHELVPEISTTEITVSKRDNRLYIDPNQNDEADTVAAPYCIRPYHQPQVSTPLEWKEVKAGLDPGMFTMENILTRLKKKGDLFSQVQDKKVANSNAKMLFTLL